MFYSPIDDVWSSLALIVLDEPNDIVALLPSFYHQHFLENILVRFTAFRLVSDGTSEQTTSKRRPWGRADAKHLQRVRQRRNVP